MKSTDTEAQDANLLAGLMANNPSTRLQAALEIGTIAKLHFIDSLVARCAIEPDFNVREILTWALTRFPVQRTLPKLIAELHSDISQAKSQALHTLSKIKDPDAWPAITSSLLFDAEP